MHIRTHQIIAGSDRLYRGFQGASVEYFNSFFVAASKEGIGGRDLHQLLVAIDGSNGMPYRVVVVRGLANTDGRGGTIVIVHFQHLLCFPV